MYSRAAATGFCGVTGQENTGWRGSAPSQPIQAACQGSSCLAVSNQFSALSACSPASVRTATVQV